MKVPDKFCSILGLLACFNFLVFAIIYDQLDHPAAKTIEVILSDVGIANSKLFFVPLFLTFDVLIFCNYNTYRKLGKVHDILWFMFTMLSGYQTSMEMSSDPTVQTNSGYIFLGIVVAYVVYRLFLFSFVNSKIKKLRRKK